MQEERHPSWGPARRVRRACHRAGGPAPPGPEGTPRGLAWRGGAGPGGGRTAWPGGPGVGARRPGGSVTPAAGPGCRPGRWSGCRDLPDPRGAGRVSRRAAELTGAGARARVAGRAGPVGAACPVPGRTRTERGWSRPGGQGSDGLHTLRRPGTGTVAPWWRASSGRGTGRGPPSRSRSARRGVTASRSPLGQVVCCCAPVSVPVRRAVAASAARSGPSSSGAAGSRGRGPRLRRWAAHPAWVPCANQ